MIEKIMKAVKSGNKKRGRNITVGAVVGMLLSCTAVMGANEYLWIKNDGGVIKFSTDNNTPVSTGNPYEENTWDGVDYVNNITLNSTSTDYGLKLSGDLSGINFTNNGLITVTRNSNAYGVYNEGTIESITNNGVIKTVKIGNAYGQSSGIYNRGTINGNVTNNGIINGIYNSGPINGNVTNNGLLLTDGQSYYGIYNQETITVILNNGLIKGESSGICNNYKISQNIINNGSIVGKNRGIDYHGTTPIINSGLLKGVLKDQERNDYFSGGIYGNGGVPKLLNIGSMLGIAIRGAAQGAGIYNTTGGEIGSIINIGSITGTSTGSGGGYGIYNEEYIIDIRNIGVIYGKTNAVKNKAGKTIVSLDNYGILATEGNLIIDNTGTITNTPTNYGLYIAEADGKVSFDDTKQSNSPVEIIVGHDESGTEIKRNMTIKNAAISSGLASGVGTSTDSFVFSATPNEFDNSILNGKNDTLKVLGTNREVKGSIINAYGTAVVFDGTDSQLTLSGTVVNGRIVEANNTVLGSDNGDILILQSGEIEYVDGTKETQNTVINGNIDMADGADTITVDIGAIINGTVKMGAGDDALNIVSGGKINGTLDGGTGNDTLNFNPAVTRTNGEINIQHNISDFENMNINTNVTLFEKTIADDGTIGDLAITGAENITIGANGILTLRLDITNIDNISGTDKIKGHALYGNNGTITSTGGKLLLALNGAGNESVISFGDTTLDGSLVTAHETKVEGEINFATTSLLHKVKRIEGKTNEVIITSKADLPTDISYKKLNEIYHSILSVDELGNFNVDDDEKLSTFLSYLNDIYIGNPYSYSSELSRKSAGMFRDIVTENIFKPETNKWMIYGGLTHVDGGTKDTYYGKGYYTYDIGSSDMDADTKVTGAYMFGEYGVSDTLTSGVVIGGNKLKSDLSNGSKVDGSALYLGAYAKKYVGNLKVTAGAGFQYGDYDADRIAVNKVASTIGTPVMQYSDNYNDMTYDIYLNGRYSHQVGENLFLEPYGTLSYTYIDQDEADEGNKTLAIETDSKSFDYTVGKVGVDLKKVIPHEKGKSTLSAGINYTKILDGADEEHITGRFKGGSDFDILVAHKNEHSIGLNAKYALELENGVLFDVKGTYSVERDSHNGSGKNRTKGEWIVGTGMGYKF